MPLETSRPRRELPLALLGWLITGATLLPFLLLTGYGVTYWLADQQKTERARLTHSAEALALAVDRELKGHVETARVLAMSRQLKSSDIEAFKALARDVAAGAAGHVVLVDRDARQLLDTRSQNEAPRPNGDTSSLARVFATGQPMVTNLSEGSQGRQDLFAVRVPVEVDGAVRYVLDYLPRPRTIYHVVSENYLPDGWFASVLDGNGRIVARSAAHEQFYGESASPEFFARLTGQKGLIDSVDLQGRAAITAFHTSQVGNWRAVVWAPKSVITNPAVQARKWALGIVVLTILASIAAAWISGRTIHTAAQRLVRAASALGQGQQIQFKPTAVKEVNITGQALVDASRAIADREQAVRLSDERFSAAFRLAPVAMAIATMGEGRQVAVNEARLKLTGHAPEEIIGKTPREIGFYFDYGMLYLTYQSGRASLCNS